MKLYSGFYGFFNRSRRINTAGYKIHSKWTQGVNYNTKGFSDESDCDSIMQKSILKKPFSFKRNYGVTSD